MLDELQFLSIGIKGVQFTRFYYCTVGNATLSIKIDLMSWGLVVEVSCGVIRIKSHAIAENTLWLKFSGLHGKWRIEKWLNANLDRTHCKKTKDKLIA